jgi:hypothetical protein
MKLITAEKDDLSLERRKTFKAFIAHKAFKVFLPSLKLSSVYLVIQCIN